MRDRMSFTCELPCDESCPIDVYQVNTDELRLRLRERGGYLP